jgi:hypothetical protein
LTSTSSSFVLAWTTDASDRLLITYSTISELSTRLPAGNAQSSLTHLVVSIRDRADCVTEVNISSVHVQPDTMAINSLLQSGTNPSTSGNQVIISQVIIGVSQQINNLNNENIQQAASGNFQ